MLSRTTRAFTRISAELAQPKSSAATIARFPSSCGRMATTSATSLSTGTSASIYHNEQQLPPAKRQRRAQDAAAGGASEYIAEVELDEDALFNGSAVESQHQQGKNKKHTASQNDKSQANQPPGAPKKRTPNTFRSEEYEAALSQPFPVCTFPPNYAHGLFLAPMVRIGTLPTRLLSLRYGANLVWGPEIVDRAIMASTRSVDPRTGLIDYLKDGKSVFSTHPVEKSRLIFQLGSANPAQAYKAIKVVADDVAGVDLNCGCPKPFSTHGGMGANLLTTPDLLCDVLRAMRHAAPAHVAVTCKIRLLPTQEDTIKLVRQIVQTGVVNAITIHCRTKEMRPREPALTLRFKEVAEAIKKESKGRIPVVVNGDCWSAEDEAKFLDMTGATSIMLARGAELNPSVFRREGKLSVPDIIAPQYAQYAAFFNNPWGNTKYCMGQLNFKDRARFEEEEDTTQSPQASDSFGPRTDTARRKTRAELNALRDKVMSSPGYPEMVRAFGLEYEVESARTADEVLAEVQQAVERLSVSS